MFTYSKWIFAPTIEEYNKGHCFRVAGVSYRSLWRWIVKMPGITVARERRVCWPWWGVGSEFVLRHTFRIEADGWEGGFRIRPNDEAPHPSEIHELRKHIERMNIPHMPKMMADGNS